MASGTRARMFTAAGAAAVVLLTGSPSIRSQEAPRNIYQELVTREPHVAQADHRIYYGSNNQHFGDLRLPRRPGPHPVAVVVHGGAWGAAISLHYMSPLAAALTCSGVATWNIEYRRLGSGGAWPAIFRDVAAAADHLRAIAPTYQLDLDRVVATGHSAGGHLALWLASRDRLPPTSEVYVKDPLPLDGVVALGSGGAADLSHFMAAMPRFRDAVIELLGGTVPERLAEHMKHGSPAELLPIGKPQVLISGDADPSVPMPTVRHYADRAARQGDRVSIVAIPGGEHFVSTDPSDPVAGPAIRHAILTQLGMDPKQPDACFGRGR